MDSVIEEIKNRLDIVDIISDYVQLKKVGTNWRALCPFHSEKGPSFYVSPSKQIYKCFGCGAGGNVFDFIMRAEGIEFSQALRILAKRAGVELKNEPKESRDKKERLLEICSLALKFFQKQFNDTTNGTRSREYLIHRGINQESIDLFQIGYAPDLWNGLSDFLVSRGYSRDEVVEAGLAIKNDQGRVYDRFRGRIMFPIFDLQGAVIGFGGRVFKENKQKEHKEAKYINTPTSIIYNKSRVLYGLNFAKQSVRQKGVVVVEGYTDVILSHQFGIDNVISTSGTALTQEHISIIKRYTRSIALCFDEDLAGQEANRRGIQMFQQNGCNPRVVILPQGQDPADIIKKDPEVWKKAIASTVPVEEYVLRLALRRSDISTPAGKKEAAAFVLPFFRNIENKIEQTSWIQRLSEGIGIKEEAIWEELNKVKEVQASQENYDEGRNIKNVSQGEKESPGATRERVLEERLLMILLSDKEKCKEVGDVEWMSPEHKKLFEWLKSGSIEKPDLQDLKELIEELEMRYDVESAEKIDFKSDFVFILAELKKIKIRDKRSQKIQELRFAQDEKRKTELLSEISNLSEYEKSEGENKKEKGPRKKEGFKSEEKIDKEKENR